PYRSESDSVPPKTRCVPVVVGPGRGSGASGPCRVWGHFREGERGRGRYMCRRQMIRSLVYDVCSCSRNGIFQMSSAYSPTVRSGENQAIRAMWSMLASVQAEIDSHSLSTLL